MPASYQFPTYFMIPKRYYKLDTNTTWQFPFQESTDLEDINFNEIFHQSTAHERQDGITGCIYCKHHKWTRGEIITNIAMFCDQFGEVKGGWPLRVNICPKACSPKVTRPPNTDTLPQALCVKQQSYNFSFDLWKIECGQILTLSDYPPW